MNIVQEGKMKDGTYIRLEDWSDNYDFMPKSGTIAAYPKSKVSHPGSFSPKGNEPFRAGFNFPSTEEAKTAFDSLVNGAKTLSDFIPVMDRKEYANCL